jgi:hypothetical protein
MSAKSPTADAVAQSLLKPNLPTNPVVKLFSSKISSCRYRSKVALRLQKSKITQTHLLEGQIRY